MARSYGVGSVREITTGRYANQWLAEWELPRDDHGRRRRRRIVRPTANEARRAMKAAMGRSSTSQRGGERLDEFLARWLDEVVRVTRRERTLVGYRQIVATHLVPAFGDRDIATLTRRDVQRWVSKQTLHPTTVRHVVACLGAAYSYAVRWELVDRNPAAGLDLPAVPPRTVRAMNPATAKALLDAVKDTRVAPVVTVALWTGMRQGELLGLRWSDVDLDGATITVTSSLSRLPGRSSSEGIRYVLTAPKSAKSIRTVPLSPDAVAVLRDEKKRQMADGIVNRFGLVFFADADRPLDGPTLTKEFQRVLAAAGHSPMRFHDLRHATASLLLGRGVALSVVSELMGHSGIAITKDTYGHLTAETRAAAIAQLAEAMA